MYNVIVTRRPGTIKHKETIQSRVLRITIINMIYLYRRLITSWTICVLHAGIKRLVLCTPPTPTPLPLPAHGIYLVAFPSEAETTL